ncbi:hypothetical protein HT031_002869 [Scenedesmus sp. PABB004]|nr:hypothetical protein HT031_002869 [Scenedesmus sp. PABB004]
MLPDVGVGVVLRARRGRNLLVQAHGLDVKAVTQAAVEAAAVLEGDLPSSIELLDTGVGFQSSLACGHLRVLGDRYAVVYRLLHQVLVVVVSAAGANVFSSLNLASGVSRLLVAEAKTVELTPERVLKKYAQVYLSVDALVSRGSLDLLGALLEAHSVLEGLGPDALKARKARALAERSAAAAAGSRQARQIARRVPQPHHDHGRFSFLAPPELTSLQANLPAYQLPELPEPDRPLPQAAPDVPLPLQDEPQQEAAEGEQPWMSFEQEQQQPAAPPVLLRYEGPPLALQEAWQVEVVGSRVARAGLVGAVRWAASEAKALAGSTPFQLQPPEGVHPAVATALKAALSSARGTRHGALLGTFLADTLSPLPAAAPLLAYALPASFGVQPLMARLTVGWVEAARRAAQQPPRAVALLTLQWHVPREFVLAATELTVDLAVPPGFGAPRRVQPPGATWAASQSLLRWQLGAAAPGASGSLVAAFRVDAGGEAAAAGLPRCHALLRLRGDGATITGVQLAQARGGGAAPCVEPGTNCWASFAGDPHSASTRPSSRGGGAAMALYEEMKTNCLQHYKDILADDPLEAEAYLEIALQAHNAIKALRARRAGGSPAAGSRAASPALAPPPGGGSASPPRRNGGRPGSAQSGGSGRALCARRGASPRRRPRTPGDSSDQRRDDAAPGISTGPAQLPGIDEAPPRAPRPRPAGGLLPPPPLAIASPASRSPSRPAPAEGGPLGGGSPGLGPGDGGGGAAPRASLAPHRGASDGGTASLGLPTGGAVLVGGVAAAAARCALLRQEDLRRELRSEQALRCRAAPGLRWARRLGALARRARARHAARRLRARAGSPADADDTLNAFNARWASNKAALALAARSRLRRQQARGAAEDAPAPLLGAPGRWRAFCARLRGAGGGGGGLALPPLARAAAAAAAADLEAAELQLRPAAAEAAAGAQLAARGAAGAFDAAPMQGGGWPGLGSEAGALAMEAVQLRLLLARHRAAERALRRRLAAARLPLLGRFVALPGDPPAELARITRPRATLERLLAQPQYAAHRPSGRWPSLAARLAGRGTETGAASWRQAAARRLLAALASLGGGAAGAGGLQAGAADAGGAAGRRRPMAWERAQLQRQWERALVRGADAVRAGSEPARWGGGRRPDHDDDSDGDDTARFELAALSQRGLLPAVTRASQVAHELALARVTAADRGAAAARLQAFRRRAARPAARRVRRGGGRAGPAGAAAAGVGVAAPAPDGGPPELWPLLFGGEPAWADGLATLTPQLAAVAAAVLRQPMAVSLLVWPPAGYDDDDSASAGGAGGAASAQTPPVVAPRPRSANEACRGAPSALGRRSSRKSSLGLGLAPTGLALLARQPTRVGA